MTKIYIAFYDEYDGCNRESWNTFYTPWVASLTRDGAKSLAKDAIKKQVIDNIKITFKVNLNTTDIDDIQDKTLQAEVRDHYDTWIKEYHIEIQEGILGDSQ